LSKQDHFLHVKGYNFKTHFFYFCQKSNRNTLSNTLVTSLAIAVYEWGVSYLALCTSLEKLYCLFIVDQFIVRVRDGKTLKL